MKGIENQFPDVFLVGAPKCGTTSIYDYFQKHPQIFVPEYKEPHFFSMPEGGKTYYPVRLVGEEGEYLELYSTCRDDQVSVDCSPSYLFYEAACGRIHHANPEAKIIIILRNPVERAISHYLMDRRIGVQRVALKECLENPKRHPMPYREYVGNGLYADQVSRYLDTFPREHVKVMFFDDFRANVEGVMREVLKFVGVDPGHVIDYTKKANVGIEHRSAIVKSFVGSGTWRRLRGYVPSSWTRRLRNLLMRRSGDGLDFAEERKRLSEIFASDILRLQVFLGMDLSDWSRCSAEDGNS